MGIVLDSSALIAAERSGQSVSKLLVTFAAEYPETQFLISSMTVMELEYGWHRASTPGVAAKRRRYLDEIFAIIPVEPFTRELGILAAKIDADAKAAGRAIATADLLIGVTALYYRYAVLTHNVRHFRMIPGLMVITAK